MIPPDKLQLTVEQQFTLASNLSLLNGCDRSQAIELAKELMKQLMVKDNVIRHFAAKDLGLLSSMANPLLMSPAQQLAEINRFAPADLAIEQRGDRWGWTFAEGSTAEHKSIECFDSPLSAIADYASTVTAIAMLAMLGKLTTS
jgi:Phycobilisome degradation protein nblA